MHIYFNDHDMEIITAYIVVIYLKIQTKCILLDKAALGVDNELETFWEGFASGTNVFLGNIGTLLPLFLLYSLHILMSVSGNRINFWVRALRSCPYPGRFSTFSVSS